MRWGLIARGDVSGLGIQTYEVYAHLNPDKVLLIDVSGLHDTGDNCNKRKVFDYPGAQVVEGWSPSTEEVDQFLDGLDAVYTAETFYSWGLVTRARARGVRLVAHINPEFADHLQNPGLAPYDLYAAPTDWLYDLLPEPKTLLPMPVATERFPRRESRAPAWKFLHVAGRPAIHDRNGTLTVLNALAHVRAPVRVTIRCLQPGYVHALARAAGIRMPRNVELVVAEDEVDDYWRLYDNQDVLLMPRRFGGLCLDGSMRITMADGTRRPIRDVEVGDEVRDEKGMTTVTGKASRRVDEHITIDARGVRLTSSVDHIHLICPKDTMAGTGAASCFTTSNAELREMKAEEVEPGDWVLMVRPDPVGLICVEMGVRPSRKGLAFWPESVRLDDGWARIIGLWLAEGSRGRYRRAGRSRESMEVKWHFGPHEEGFANEVVDFLVGHGIGASKAFLRVPGASFGESGTWTVRCRSMWLYELFDRLGLGRGAWGKRAPDLDASLVPALLGGWLDGDGNQDNGAITGFSRSTGLIRDLWRLAAKVGMLGYITQNGQKLNFSRPYATRVASWTTRLRITRSYVRAPVAQHWRKHERGWVVRVRSVERTLEPLDVVAIETTSGRYVAEDILTHNCLPMQEAMGAGMPVLLGGHDPYAAQLPAEWAAPSRKSDRFMTRCWVDVHSVDEIALAAAIDRLAADADAYSQASCKAAQWAEQHSWDNWKGRYLEALEGRESIAL